MHDIGGDAPGIARRYYLLFIPYDQFQGALQNRADLFVRVGMRGDLSLPKLNDRSTCNALNNDKKVRTPMNYNTLGTEHVKNLQAMVSADRFSTGESVLKLHAKDQSHHRGCRPEAVIWPRNTAEVVKIVTYANANRLPVVGWGSGSSLEGNPIPVRKGLVLDFNQMNRILDVREADFQVDVEPGVVYQDLNEHLKYTGLFFPPDPGARATVGGMIANNASGTRTVYYLSLIHI